MNYTFSGPSTLLNINFVLSLKSFSNSFNCTDMEPTAIWGSNHLVKSGTNICDSQAPRWLLSTPISWNSHPCVVLSQILVIMCDWQNMVEVIVTLSLLRLGYKRQWIIYWGQSFLFSWITHSGGGQLPYFEQPW